MTFTLKQIYKWLFLYLIGPLEKPLSVSHSLMFSEKSIINHHQCCQALGPGPSQGPRMTQEDPMTQG